jgi:hypothetical protein
MVPFDAAKAFQQIRAESQRERDAADEQYLQKQEAWAAYDRRSAAFGQLIDSLPCETAVCTWDVGRATAQMIEYAQTLPVEWVKARVEFVRERIAQLAADGRPVQGTGFKEIMLNLLLLARGGEKAKVAEIFNEAKRGEPDDVARFRWHLVNWLVDKVVDGYHPLPEELKPHREASAEGLEEKTPLDRSVIPTCGGNGDIGDTGQGKDRLHFDPQTQTITLDGTPYKIADPKAFDVYKEIANSCPVPLTQAKLQERVAGCRGDKKIRQLLNGLPKQLRDTVPSGPNGYWLDLNPLQNRVKRSHRKKSRS